MVILNQDFNKLIDVKRNLQSQFDREPTFAEWADAVGLSSRALRSEFHSWKRSREKLICSNFRMVVHIAKQYQGRGIGLQDLLQVNNRCALAFLLFQQLTSVAVILPLCCFFCLFLFLAIDFFWGIL